MPFASSAVSVSYSRSPWFARLFLLLCLPWIPVASALDTAEEALAATLETLTESPHASHRKDALSALEARAAHANLSAQAIAALERSALDDSHVSNRLLATQLLITQPLDTDSKRRLGEMWTGLLGFPVTEPDVLRNHLHPASDQRVRPQAVRLLAELYEPPYPEHVVIAWIHQLRSFGFDESIRLLGQVKNTNGFSEQQRTVAAQVAARLTLSDRRQSIYQVFSRKLDSSDIEAVVTTMQSARSAGAQALAATELQLYFNDARVPIEISDAALATLNKSADPSVQLATARLIAAGDESNAAKEAKLIEVMRVLRNNYDLAPLILSMYEASETEALVSRLLPESRTPVNLRMALLAQLIDQAESGQSIDADVAKALELAARNTKNYVEISQIKKAYEATQVKPPMVVWLKSRETQSSAVGLAFLALVVINGIAGMLALVMILFRDPAPGAAKAHRLSKFLIWLVLSVVMLGLMGWAFLGFIGHNYAPAPAHSLQMNSPLYIGTIAYLPLMWILGRRPGT